MWFSQWILSWIFMNFVTFESKHDFCHSHLIYPTALVTAVMHQDSQLVHLFGCYKLTTCFSISPASASLMTHCSRFSHVQGKNLHSNVTGMGFHWVIHFTDCSFSGGIHTCMYKGLSHKYHAVEITCHSKLVTHSH